MAGQLTIFAPLVESLTKEIAELIERKKRLEAQNKSFNAEIDSNRACLDDADWYDKKEIENDILNTEREIRMNNDMITKLEAEIKAKQTLRDEYIAVMENVNQKRR